jgi:hypothetical protein
MKSTSNNQLNVSKKQTLKDTGEGLDTFQSSITLPLTSLTPHTIIILMYNFVVTSTPRDGSHQPQTTTLLCQVHAQCEQAGRDMTGAQ